MTTPKPQFDRKHVLIEYVYQLDDMLLIYIYFIIEIMDMFVANLSCKRANLML